MAEEEAASSDFLTATLTEAILAQDDHFVEDLRASRTRRTQRLAERNKVFTDRADALAADLTGRAARGFEEARLRGGSAWLSFIPLEALGIDLDSTTFRDAIALRMGLELPEAPTQEVSQLQCGLRLRVGLRQNRDRGLLQNRDSGAFLAVGHVSECDLGPRSGLRRGG